jgi:hypothetical protein
MFNVFGASTLEIDDVDIAIKELTDAFSGKTFLKNTAAVITCHGDYIDEGVVSAISEHFGFPIVGITAKSGADMNGLSEFILTMTVFTSDTAEFAAVLTDPVTPDSKEMLQSKYKEAASGRKPALTLIFPGLLTPVSGDFYVNALSEVAADVPLFGALAVDHTADYGKSRVIYQGESYTDRAAMLLIFSDEIKPIFLTGTLPLNIVSRDKAVVTDAEGRLIKTVNDISAKDYFISVGVRENADGSLEGINMCILSVDFGDGTPPVIRALFSVTPDGSVTCGGDIPIGAKISIAYIETADIIASDKELVAAYGDKVADSQYMLIFSCIGRFFLLGYDSSAEMELIKNGDPAGMPFAMAYCGGEICPTFTEDGKLVNRAHNHTLIGLAL